MLKNIEKEKGENSGKYLNGDHLSKDEDKLSLLVKAAEKVVRDEMNKTNNLKHSEKSSNTANKSENFLSKNETNDSNNLQNPTLPSFFVNNVYLKKQNQQQIKTNNEKTNDHKLSFQQQLILSKFNNTVESNPLPSPSTSSSSSISSANGESLKNESSVTLNENFTTLNAFVNSTSNQANMPVFIGKNGKPTRPFKAYPKEALSLPIGSSSTLNITNHNVKNNNQNTNGINAMVNSCNNNNNNNNKNIRINILRINSLLLFWNNNYNCNKQVNMTQAHKTNFLFYSSAKL